MAEQQKAKHRPLPNSALLHQGKMYQPTLEGYGMYLVDRNYSVSNASGGESTVMEYARAIAAICQEEQCSFGELLANASVYAIRYGKEGAKQKLGDRQHGTWRNAVARLKEFSDYLRVQ